MLVPHRRENPEFSETRHPADQLENAVVFVGLEAVAGDQFGGDFNLIRLHVLTLSPGTHLCSLPPCGGGLGRGVGHKRRRLWCAPLPLPPEGGESRSCRADRWSPNIKTFISAPRLIHPTALLGRSDRAEKAFYGAFPRCPELCARKAFAHRVWIGFKGSEISNEGPIAWMT